MGWPPTASAGMALKAPAWNLGTWEHALYCGRFFLALNIIIQKCMCRPSRLWVKSTCLPGQHTRRTTGGLTSPGCGAVVGLGGPPHWSPCSRT